MNVTRQEWFETIRPELTNAVRTLMGRLSKPVVENLMGNKESSSALNQYIETCGSMLHIINVIDNLVKRGKLDEAEKAVVNLRETVVLQTLKS